MGNLSNALEPSEHHPGVKTLFTFFKSAVRLTALNRFGPIPRVVKCCMPNSLGGKAAAHVEFIRDKIDKPIAQGRDSSRYHVRHSLEQPSSRAGSGGAVCTPLHLCLFLAESQTSAVVTCRSVTCFYVEESVRHGESAKGDQMLFPAPFMISPSHPTARLPHLHAVIQETLRLHPPNSHKNEPREADREAVVVCGRERAIVVSFTIMTYFSHYLPGAN